jgi:hypothetical protein
MAASEVIAHERPAFLFLHHSTWQTRGTQMVRIWIIGIALALALAMPATAQKRSVPQILERLHALCDQDYKPACIKLGFVIGRLQPGVARKLRRDHPEWWWWERW